MGGMSYPNHTFDPDIQPDGVLDIMNPLGDVDTVRFDGAGPHYRASTGSRRQPLGQLIPRWDSDPSRPDMGPQGLGQRLALQSPHLAIIPRRYDVDRHRRRWTPSASGPPDYPAGTTPGDDQPILQLLPYKLHIPRIDYRYRPRIIVAP